MAWKPSDEKIRFAIEWLRANEGEEGGEREACEAVAGWLEKQLQDKLLRSEARKAGVPVAKLRRRIAELSQH